MTRRWMPLLILAAIISMGPAGCVQRTLTIRTDPPGALISLNDQEIGRTPVTREFTWYGVYDLEIRMAGYESIKTTVPVIAPWWQWVPMDFFAEFFPLTDHHDLSYTMRVASERQGQADLLIRRAEQLGGELQGSHFSTTQQAKPAKPQTKPAIH